EDGRLPRGWIAHRGARQRSGTARGRVRRDLSAARGRQGQPMTLVKRIIVEKKPVLVPLALALVLNVAVYAIAVYPLETKAASASDRAAAAAQSLSAAERELAAARGLITGKSHADPELATF